MPENTINTHCNNTGIRDITSTFLRPRINRKRQRFMPTHHYHIRAYIEATIGRDTNNKEPVTFKDQEYHKYT